MRRQRYNLRDTEENTDRWMISYADFITLLFAFFVVMYAISSVNDDKYRAVAENLRTNFGIVPTGGAGEPSSVSLLDVRVDADAGDSVIPLPLRSMPGPVAAEPVPRVAPGEQQQQPRQASLQQLSRQLRAMLDGLIRDGEVALTRTSRGLELEINSRLLFASASSSLNADYRPLLIRVAKVLQGQPNAVDVEGFTDNKPIYTSRFPSNWELSAARAAAVIRLLVEHGVAPSRLAAVGYGPYRPLATNTTAAGRAKNRRVVLVIRDRERQLPTTPGETS